MNKLFFGGNTTDPEVKALMEKFSAIKAGDLLRHETLASAIGATVKSIRYYTVMRAFRKALARDRDLVLLADPGSGYKVLSADDRVDLGVATVGRGLRFVKRGGRTISTVVANRGNELTESKRRVADHASRLISNLMSAGRSAMREIRNPGMQERLPLRQPPE